MIIAFTAAVLGVGTTAVVAAAGLRGPRGPIQLAWPASCPTPTLTGAVVDVTLTDMGAMMGPAMMGSGGNGRYGPAMMEPGWDGPNAPAAPPNGYGWQNGYPGPGIRHDADFRQPGHRAGGPGVAASPQHRDDDPRSHGATAWQQSLTGTAGHRCQWSSRRICQPRRGAARSCGPDDGDGILPATTGWTTVTLTPRRYELLCNIAGHYAAGMYTELDVISNR
ncbi:hypothetical protein [Mycolicibacterium chlorophenolicum]|uniref:hypothetical protein n=1 Tax=Mycolicibacterium chlorophenolicum TaxID=37916 RepID=UPI000AB14F6B|nr:hypothetical protein [Mycolicibacterium chlorophenolicum]